MALRAVVEVRDAAQRFAQHAAAPQLDARLKEQLRDLGTSLPALWVSGRLTPSQRKEVLRSLIRRVVVNRPIPDTLEVHIVWVSGAVTLLHLHPLIQRASDVEGYEALVERVLALGAAGFQDRVIARRLSAAGFHAARSATVSAALVGQIRRAHGQSSLTEQFKSEAQIDGQWTVFGLAQEVGVHRNWLYARIRTGALTATRHSVTGHYLIPGDPSLLARLREQRERCCYR